MARHYMHAAAALAFALALIPLSAGAADSALTGTTWQLTSMNRETAAPWGTLKIDANGTVTGRSGCNALAGRAVIDGQRIAFEGIVATMRPCSTPQMTNFGMNYTSLLAEAKRWREERGRLYLGDSKGNDILIFQREGSVPEGLPEESPGG